MKEWKAKIAVDPGWKRKQVRAASSRYAAKRASEGLVRIAVWVPQEHADLVREYAAGLVRAAQKSHSDLA
jgi:hypothetical protein